MLGGLFCCLTCLTLHSGCVSQVQERDTCPVSWPWFTLRTVPPFQPFLSLWVTHSSYLQYTYHTTIQYFSLCESFVFQPCFHILYVFLYYSVRPQSSSCALGRLIIWSIMCLLLTTSPMGSPLLVFCTTDGKSQTFTGPLRYLLPFCLYMGRS